jgi:Chloramphenicol phosphotransferase-like protein
LEWLEIIERQGDEGERESNFFEWSNHPVLFVGVDCPLEELERRERERGDRSPGQAKWQYEHIHGHATYDITVNTFEMTIEACADTITSMMDRPEDWKAFKTLKNQLEYKRYHASKMTISEEYANSEERAWALTSSQQRKKTRANQGAPSHNPGHILILIRGNTNTIRQAPEFFQRQGYTVYSILDEFKDGIACYQFKKRLDGK